MSRVRGKRLRRRQEKNRKTRRSDCVATNSMWWNNHWQRLAAEDRQRASV